MNRLMDPNTLEQLLDCPVCLERLDETNRVLPCQHTFCKKCLETVKSKFNELRCPECRTKYVGSMKDLPCNIFVIRILEQLKQVEKKAQATKSSSLKMIVASSSSSKPSTSRLVRAVESKCERSPESVDVSSLLDHMMSSLVIRDGSESQVKNVFSDRRDPVWMAFNGQRYSARSSQNDTKNNAKSSMSSNHGRRILRAVRKHQTTGTSRRMPSLFYSPTTTWSSSSFQPRTQNNREEKPFSFNANSTFSFSVELKSTRRNFGNPRRNRRIEINKSSTQPSNP